MRAHKRIPKTWEVQPLKPGQKAAAKATCGHCGLSWDDGKVTGMTPAPSARCPFEAFHLDAPEPAEQVLRACNTGRKIKLSISDDDLCSGCRHCAYNPGELSGCALKWPGFFDADGYCRRCPKFTGAKRAVRHKTTTTP